LAKAYNQPLFQDVSFTMQRGEKWGVLGPNGSGKTTLLQCVTGGVTPDAGRVILGTGVDVAYFDQQLGNLDPDVELLEAVRPAGADMTVQQRRDLLAMFGLAGPCVHQAVRALSGGQRNRALLGRLAAQRANLMILDEPTNHLDLWARDALERALNQYDGTLLFVSHDRYFLNRVVDHLLVFDTNRCCVIEGNYDTYLQLASTASENGNENASSSRITEQPVTKPRRPTTHLTKRRRKFPYRNVADIEGDIQTQESRIEQLHVALMSPEVLRDGERVKDIHAEIERRPTELMTLYERWDEAVELN